MPKRTDRRTKVETRASSLRNLAVGYTRVSTPGQGERGASLETQRVAIENFADAMNYTLIEMFDDVASGVGAKSFFHRECLHAALDLVVREGAVLVVWDWDRLSRHAGFERQVRKVLPDFSRIICAREGNTMRDAAREARFAHSEHKATIISDATKAGMAKMRAQGAVFGNPAIKTDVQPLGAFTWSSTRRDHDQAIADILRDHPNAMNLSRAGVSELLNRSGLRTLHGNEWDKSRVTGPLKRARAILLEEEKAQVSSDPRFGMF